MINFKNLKNIQVEITNRCQAACPMCPRNYNGLQKNPNLELNDWSLAEYKKIISQDVLDQIDLVYFCGNFGDPILNRDLLEMCEYTAQASPGISLRIHTNGSARTKDWWQKLAKVLPEDSIVIFGIDGLEDTHYVYRIGTSYDTIIENATAFIEAGGNAEWAFIKFKHNQHQVDEARKRADEIGFSCFSVKTSNRFIKESHAVLDKFNNVSYYLYPADDSEMTLVTEESFKELFTWAKGAKIDCASQYNNEIYIDANKHVFPCCFTVSLPYFYSRVGDVIHNTRLRMRDQYNTLVNNFGGLEAVDASKRSIREIVEDSQWISAWYNSWESQEMTICAKICGKSDKKLFSSPNEQYVIEENLGDPTW